MGQALTRLGKFKDETRTLTARGVTSPLPKPQKAISKTTQIKSFFPRPEIFICVLWRHNRIHPYLQTHSRYRIGFSCINWLKVNPRMTGWPILDQGEWTPFPSPCPPPSPFFLQSLKRPRTEDAHFPSTGPRWRLKSVGWVWILPLPLSSWEILISKPQFPDL